MQAESELSFISVRGVTRHQLRLVVRSRKGRHRTRSLEHCLARPACLPSRLDMMASTLPTCLCLSTAGEHHTTTLGSSDARTHGRTDARTNARTDALTRALTSGRKGVRARTVHVLLYAIHMYAYTHRHTPACTIYSIYMIYRTVCRLYNCVQTVCVLYLYIDNLLTKVIHIG
jgi:hypothetical protein